MRSTRSHGPELLHRVGLRMRAFTPVVHWPSLHRRPHPATEAPEIEAPSAKVVSRLCAVSRWTAAAAFLVGYHGLLGWLFDIGLLRAPSADPPIRAHEALACVIAGAALFLVQLGGDTLEGMRRPLLGLSGGLVMVLAFAGILGDPASAEAMSLVSGIAFAVVGFALVVLAAFRDHGLAEVLGLVSGAMSLRAIASYAYGAEPFPGQMPLYTATAVLLLSVALVCIRADQGFMAKLASTSFGGAMARRLLPATILGPFALGGLLLLGLRAGLFALEPGLALFVVALSVVFVAVVWWGVNSLYRMDTQRRQAERELEETAGRLARSNADLEQFAYVTSHDLKEPLRAISGSVQVLQARMGPTLAPEMDEFIHHIVDGSNRMQTLIDDLLTYSRLTTREAPLEPTDCEEIFATALANLEVPLRESRAVVTHDPLPTVRADRTQLLQVFQNLVSNALKYRSERTPKIHASAEDEGAEWLFSVRDNGIGIAPQYTDRIFKIFQRLHTRTTYPGTGIGLAVCKKVIERHGGRIWVESEPEEGSTFYFTLPKGPPP